MEAQLLDGEALGKEVVRRMRQARESVWIATANVKAMMLEGEDGRFRPIVDLFNLSAPLSVSGSGSDLVLGQSRRFRK